MTNFRANDCAREVARAHEVHARCEHASENDRELAALAAGLPSVVRARALSGYVGRGGQAARSADAERAVSQFYNDRCGVAVVQVLNSIVRRVEADALVP